MQGSEALRYLDEAIAKARESRLLREQKSWFQQAKDRQDAVDAVLPTRDTSVYTDTKSYGFINGPMSPEWVSNFLSQMRAFNASKAACDECQRLAVLHADDKSIPICSLHHSWGHGMCWKHGE